MKKLFAILLSFVICFSFVACSKQEQVSDENPEVEVPASTDADVLELDAEYTVEGYVKFRMRSVLTTDKVVASMGSSLTYPVDSDANIYADVIFDAEYLGSESINCADIMKAWAVGANDMIYEDVLYCIEKDNMTSITSYGNIEPLSSVRLHVAFELPKTENAVELYFDFNGDIYMVDYTLGEMKKKETSIFPGGTIEKEDYAKFEFLGIEYSEDVTPSNTKGFYTHYPVENPDNIYLVVRYNITNYQSVEMDYETFVGVNLVADGKYRYDGFVVAETADGTSFTGYDTVKPLATEKMYYLIEVPKSVMEADYKINILFDKEDYVYQGAAVKATMAPAE